MLDCDHYLTPATLDEALALLAEHGPRARVVAGATDLLPWARPGRGGRVHVPVLVDIAAIAELSERAVEGGRIRLGAATPFARFLDDPLLRAHLPVMGQTAVWFADDQIREQATLGGNLVNASPAADGFPAMLALNAELELVRLRAGARETRGVPLADFVTGPGTTCLAPGELVRSIVCDVQDGFGSAFEKVGHRRSLVLSTVCVAALVKLDAARRRFAEVRLGLAAVGPRPVRLGECERALAGQPPSAAAIAAAARLAAPHVASRTRQDYRREVLVHFVQRSVVAALAQLGVHLDAPPAPLKETVNG